MSPRALIFGISGQDGAYLSQLLLSKGYEVFGTSRDAQVASFAHLRRLKIAERIRLSSVGLTDLGSVLRIIAETTPDEIYNLAGQSSVSLSFEQPIETFESIALGTLNILQAMRLSDKPSRLYSAGSGESFGDTNGNAADESTPFRPRSPYGVAKATAFWEVANYREAYGLYACTGILFNHESPLRPERFVTRKIAKGVVRISRTGGRLTLGRLSMSRDWGWAPEYVEAMWTMLQQRVPDDFVIATGRSHSLAHFVNLAFSEVGLDWKEHVDCDPVLARPADIEYGAGNPAKANKVLGWTAGTSLGDIVHRLVLAELEGN